MVKQEVLSLLSWLPRRRCFKEKNTTDFIFWPEEEGHTNNDVPLKSTSSTMVQLELELIQTQMAQKPMLRAEVGMRVRCANKASAE